MATGVALALSFVVIWAISKSILVVPEGSLVKTFALGKLHKSYLAGFHVGWFDRAIYKRVSLKIGSVAIVSSETTIEVEGHQLSAKFSEVPRIGAPVRIERFEGTEPVVTSRDVPDVRTVRCEKCGHHNQVCV